MSEAAQLALSFSILATLFGSIYGVARLAQWWLMRKERQAHAKALADLKASMRLIDLDDPRVQRSILDAMARGRQKKGTFQLKDDEDELSPQPKDYESDDAAFAPNWPQNRLTFVSRQVP